MRIDSNPDVQRAKNQSVKSALDDGFGWHKYESGRLTLWLSGHVHGVGGTAVANDLAKLGGAPAAERVAKWLRELSGNFALVARSGDRTLAAVDSVRSIPLFFARHGGAWAIDNRAERLRRRAGLGTGDVDPDAALALAMAGYTIGTDTLYKGLHQLGPGEFALFRDGAAAPRRHKYYAYRPWRVRAGDPALLRRRLAEVTLGIFEKMRDSLDGRTLLVPLSAGLDSRLVVAAMRHLGYRDVKTFSYGHRGNHEAETARRIADRLGFDWTFVPLSLARQRDYFQSSLHREYLAYADSCASVPFEQDLPVLCALKRQGYVPDDAVIANGNSGDYISGAHIVPALHTPRPDLSPEARERRILDALIGKHFRLWQCLATPENDARIAARLRRSLKESGAETGAAEVDHGLYECAEFHDRQCKYVITGQRIYEFIGHEWRLPLWDIDYLEFWEGVPLEHKAGQILYREMLEEQDWGGVWRDIPVNARTVRPRWIVAPRLAAKALHAPLGRRRWHRFERRYFSYWMDNLGSLTCVPYARVARDRRGHRHAVSWLTKAYLHSKGLNLAGRAS